MKEQLHKRFADEGVRTLFESYLKREIEIGYVLEILQLKRARFFRMLKKYRENPQSFSIQYPNKNAARKIDTEIEKNILKELYGYLGQFGLIDLPEDQKTDVLHS